MPFELRLPLRKASRYGRMTREQFDTEPMKGIESMNFRKTYTADEVDAKLKQEFDIWVMSILLTARKSWPVSDLRLHAFGLEALDPVNRIQEEIRPLDFMPARYTIMIGDVEKHKLYWWRQSHNNYPDLLWWKRCRGHR